MARLMESAQEPVAPAEAPEVRPGPDHIGAPASSPAQDGGKERPRVLLFLVVDVETNGERPPAALIELGWESVRLASSEPALARDEPGYVFGELTGSQLFGLGGQEMDVGARAAHHISPEELAGFLPYDHQYGMGFADGLAVRGVTHVVAHNTSFEEQWLDFGLPWICTYKCALHAFPESPSHSNQALKYYLGVHDLSGFYPPHRARPDAMVTARILARLLDRYPVEQLVEWTNAPRLVLKMPFGKHKGQRLTELPLDYLQWVANPARCEAADEDLRYACTTEIERRGEPVTGQTLAAAVTLTRTEADMRFRP